VKGREDGERRGGGAAGVGGVSGLPSSRRVRPPTCAKAQTRPTHMVSPGLSPSIPMPDQGKESKTRVVSRVPTQRGRRHLCSARRSKTASRPRHARARARAGRGRTGRVVAAVLETREALGENIADLLAVLREEKKRGRRRRSAPEAAGQASRTAWARGRRGKAGCAPSRRGRSSRQRCR
jgi:hypothetical protein